jgi:hypothetical protein
MHGMCTYDPVHIATLSSLIMLQHALSPSGLADVHCREMHCPEEPCRQVHCLHVNCRQVNCPDVNCVAKRIARVCTLTLSELSLCALSLSALSLFESSPRALLGCELSPGALSRFALSYAVSLITADVDYQTSMDPLSVTYHCTLHAKFSPRKKFIYELSYIFR